MKIILARPRGFCAGVERAIKCVEQALERFGEPVYVLNHIVHNADVVQELQRKGAVFVRTLDEVPAGAHLLFSAHGVSPECWTQAEALHLNVIDATCPLVEKVHNEARRFAAKGLRIILIGEVGHDEVTGTTGWAPDHIMVVRTVEDVEKLDIPADAPLAYLSQTTLSVDDCDRVLSALRRRFPGIQGPRAGDICYATQNRQGAVNTLAHKADLVLVVGDSESANSSRLADICRQMGRPSHLIRSADMIDESWFRNIGVVLVTSGASVPERLVQGVIERLRARGPCEVEEITVSEENVHFKLPAPLT